MKQRLKELRDHLNSGLIEREEAIRLALLSALAGEHMLLIGEPGTAKSALARKQHLAFKGSEYFERLLTKFSVPEELFGSLSIKALENDSYKRLIDRYLPAAGIAFIDEIFKANSAIPNALLTVLNEREFDNGDARVKVPLISVIAASNELLAEGGLKVQNNKNETLTPTARSSCALTPPAPCTAGRKRSPKRYFLKAYASLITKTDHVMSMLSVVQNNYWSMNSI